MQTILEFPDTVQPVFHMPSWHAVPFTNRIHFVDCTDTFEQFTNKNAGGATLLATADTQLECQSACLNNPYHECPAYEFNPSSSECWIHSSKPTSLNDFNGLTHYSRLQCTSGGWMLPY